MPTISAALIGLVRQGYPVALLSFLFSDNLTWLFRVPALALAHKPSIGVPGIIKSQSSGGGGCLGGLHQHSYLVPWQSPTNLLAVCGTSVSQEMQAMAGAATGRTTGDLATVTPSLVPGSPSLIRHAQSEIANREVLGWLYSQDCHPKHAPPVSESVRAPLAREAQVDL